MTATKQVACSQAPGNRPYPPCSVDDPDGNVDPVLVVQASTSRSSETDGTRPLFVEVIGELDAYAADSITSELERIDGAHGVVLDLAEVSSIGRAGLRCLTAFLDKLVASKKTVWLHEPSRDVRRLLSIVEITRFQMCKSSVSKRRPPSHKRLPDSPRRRWQWDAFDALGPRRAWAHQPG